MALSANSVFEVQTGGSDTNGGGFVTGAAGTDYSLVAAKRTATGSNDSTTDAVAVGTGVITSVTAAFTSAIVGNIISLSGGTGTLAQGWYQVTVFTSATSITVDRNVAAGNGITMNIGGALASPGMAGGVGLVTNNAIYIKAGTYTITSATPNISGGCLSSAGATLFIEGYQTTRGDLGIPPLLQASGISTFTLILISAAGSTVYNISFDGASLTSSRGLNLRGVGFKLSAVNFTNSAFVQTTVATFARCTATGCSTASVFLSGSYIQCIAYDNTITGFVVPILQVAVRCISDSNTGASTDGFSVTGQAINCIAYANGRDGFRQLGNAVVQNCIAESNIATGINNNNTAGVILTNNATFGNATGVSVGAGIANLNISPVVGTSSFFTNATGQDFSLNNTAGAGAVARAAGYPGVLPIGGTGFLDIGVLQHADPAGSSGGARLAGIGGLASAG